MWTSLSSLDLSPHVHGFKSYNLSRIINQTDLIVPDGIVLKEPLIIDLNHGIKNTCISINEIVKDLIHNYIDKYILKYPLIIRSSTNLEDRPSRSFAGVFKSFKNITAENQVRNSIIDITNPLRKEVLESYDIIVDSYKMNIIIQNYILCNFLFIVFTKDVVNNTNDYIIEVYNDEENIARFNLSKNGLILKKLFEREPRTLDSIFNNKKLEKLSLVIKSIRNVFRNEQNIELGLYQNDFYVFQSRSITI